MTAVRAAECGGAVADQAYAEIAPARRGLAEGGHPRGSESVSVHDPTDAQPALSRPAPVDRRNLIRLQRAAGNGAVARLMQHHQPRGAPARSSEPDPEAPVTEQPRTEGGPGLDREVREPMEAAFGQDFGEVRVRADDAAEESTKAVGAKAYTVGSTIVFGRDGYRPQTPEGRRTLAHELTHVVQQRTGRSKGAALEQEAEEIAGAVSSGATVSLPETRTGSGGPARLQAAPAVTAVAPSATEIGVGRSITATATVAGSPRLRWTLVGAPAGVTVTGTGRRATIVAAPGSLAGAGGAFTVQAALSATPADNAVSAVVTLVGITGVTFTPVPAFPAIASLIPATGPANTADPNRDGVTGNTATATAVTLPAGRPATVLLPTPRDASVAGNVITPGATTGNLAVRVQDTATRTERAATLPINPVPTALTSFGGQAAGGPYGALNGPITWRASGGGAPLTRIIGEAMTMGGADVFNIMPGFNGIGPNPTPILALAVPANSWTDQVVTGSGNALIDVNRYVGPGVAQTLPARSIIRQGFHWLGWAGLPRWSAEFSNGIQRRSLVQRGPGVFRFTTEHIQGSVSSRVRDEAYVGPPLIIFSAVTTTPLAPAAAGLAADGVATAAIGLTSSVAGRTVNWTVVSGPMAFTAGAAAAPVAGTATLQSGLVAGSFPVQAVDAVFPNRRVRGNVVIRPVALSGVTAAPANVPAGTLTSTVTVNAQPGGRTVNFTLDAAATAAGVTVLPTAPGAPAAAARSAVVTRPAGFTGTVTVTASDSVLAGKTASGRVRFR